eukprot:g2280.t1
MTHQGVGQKWNQIRKATRYASAFAAAMFSYSILVENVHAIGTEDSDASRTAICQSPGQWLSPENQQVLHVPDVFDQAARPGVVLLGESHTSKEDHLWQLQTLAGLHANHPNIVIGFESFPRAVQPVLDEWSSGTLSEQDFLKKVRWNEIWGYDADFYMPLFHFARQNRLPMKALNVDRALVSRVGRTGWADIPVKDREGLTDPAAAESDYRNALAEVYAVKAAMRHTAPGSEDNNEAAPKAPGIEEILKDPGFDRFVQAQLTWDRAMAEALAEARHSDPDALVVGILGRGHVEHGYGIPHQLADLGIAPVTSLLPVKTGKDCNSLEPTLADAVFLTDNRQSETNAPDRPRLGVFIETADDGGVRLLEIVDGSIAAATDLSPGDVIVGAAGVTLQTSADLVDIVSRQAPGTWLPLEAAPDTVPTHHDLRVELNPETGSITVKDAITVDGREQLFLRFADWMTLDGISQNGKSTEGVVHGDGLVVSLDDAERQTVTVSLSGTVPALAQTGRSRDLPNAFAGSEGAFLSGYAGWFPYVGDKVISYRLKVSVPAPFHAVSSGTVIGETTVGGRNTALFEKDLSLEPPSLFAGPYEVNVRSVDGITLRTYFPERLSGYADQYLETAGRYLSDFSIDIGAYPYTDFHIISSPLPVGLGYPNLTYIGEMIVPMPFMQGQSLAHEILHNWWGNGVHVDYGSGNWAEGLTTYMADYGLARDKGPDAARQMRLGWLRDYAALPPERDQAVNRFISKRHQAAQVVGYNKTAHIFHMLEGEIGSDAFAQGIRRFWSGNKFKIAGWTDLQSAFEATSGEDLEWFFTQWIERPGAPTVAVTDVQIERDSGGYVTSFTVKQSAPAFRLRLPVELETQSEAFRRPTTIEDLSTTLRFETKDRPTRIKIDPDFDLFRHLLPGESPPILRDVTLASAVDVVVLDDKLSADDAMAAAPGMVDRGTKLRLSDDYRTGQGPALVVGSLESLEKFAAKNGLARLPSLISQAGAAAWADETESGDPVLLVFVDGKPGLRTVGRALRHYGRQSFVVFADGLAIDRGIWPGGESPLSISLPKDEVR